MGTKITTMRKKMIQKQARNRRRKIGAAVLGIMLLFLGKWFVMDLIVVNGKSMEPTLVDGQVLLLYKAAYWNAKPQTGDIVVVQHGLDQYIKRIGACPGEIPPGETNQLPEGRYYILGDNPNVSVDSRDFGSISENLIIGKILYGGENKEKTAG